VRRVGAASQELETRSTWALSDGNCSCKLDQVASGDRELLEEWLQVVDRIVNSGVGS